MANQTEFIKGLFYNPKKFLTSANKANIKLLESVPEIYQYREAWGKYVHKITDINGNLIVYSELLSSSLLGKFWARLNNKYAFYKDRKEILRYIHSSLILFPDGTKLEYDYRKFHLKLDFCIIEFNKNYELVFECKRDFLYETMIIGFNSFWHPHYTPD